MPIPSSTLSKSRKRKWAIGLSAVILLGSWLCQQFFFEKWDDKLADIEQARQLIALYESDNALFNALYAIASSDVPDQNRVRSLQIANYRNGLERLTPLISDERRAAITAAVTEASGADNVSGVQAEIDETLAAFSQEERDVRNKKERWFWAFVILYVAGTTILILGTTQDD